MADGDHESECEQHFGECNAESGCDDNDEGMCGGLGCGVGGDCGGGGCVEKEGGVRGLFLFSFDKW